MTDDPADTRDDNDRDEHDRDEHDREPIAVLVVDDATEVVSALVAVLGRDPRFRVVGVATGPHEAGVAAEVHPDLATVDVRMPDGGGFEAARRILVTSPTTRVVALSAFSTPSLRRRMTEAGAIAYLEKGMSASVLLDQLADIAGTGPRGIQK